MTSRSRPMLRAGHARAKLQRRMSVSMWSGIVPSWSLANGVFSGFRASRIGGETVRVSGLLIAARSPTLARTQPGLELVQSHTQVRCQSGEPDLRSSADDALRPPVLQFTPTLLRPSWSSPS